MLTSEAPPAPPSGTDPSRERRLHRASQLIAAVIVAGYLSVPLAVMAGLVDQEPADDLKLVNPANRRSRVLGMVAAMEAEGFGSCTNIGECRAVCPKEIGLDVIGFMNADLLAALRSRR